MNKEMGVLEKSLTQALSGKDAHVEVLSAFEGLDWRLAGRRGEGEEHSVFQLLNHLSYWQDWVLRWLDGEDPGVPEHASGGWPGDEKPRSLEDWEQALEHFKKGVDELKSRSHVMDLLAVRGDKSPLEMFTSIALHNSYHIGQVVLLRRALGAWPPPSGGVTW